MAEDNELEWRAPEFPYYEKNLVWRASVIVIAIAIAVIAFFQQNFLFAVFALVGGVLILYWGHRKPEMLTFHLSEKGLDIAGRTFYPWDGLTGFVIFEGEGDGEMIVRTNRKLNTHLKIIIPRESQEAVHEFVSAFLPEMEYEESLTDRISRLLKF